LLEAPSDVKPDLVGFAKDPMTVFPSCDTPDRVCLNKLSD